MAHYIKPEIASLLQKSVNEKARIAFNPVYQKNQSKIKKPKHRSDHVYTILFMVFKSDERKIIIISIAYISIRQGDVSEKGKEEEHSRQIKHGKESKKNQAKRNQEQDKHFFLLFGSQKNASNLLTPHFDRAELANLFGG